MFLKSRNQFIWRLVSIILMMTIIVACTPDIEKLAETGNTKKLIEALNYEKDAQIRASAARALGEIGDPVAIKAIIPLLADSDPEVHQAAADVLIQFGNEAAKVLVAEAKNSDENMHDLMIDLLSKMDQSAYASLCLAISDVDQEAVKVAKDVYLQMGASAVEPLMVCLANLQDNKITTMHETHALINEIGETAIAPLISLIPVENLNTQVKLFLSDFDEAIYPQLFNALLDDSIKPSVLAYLAELGAPIIPPLLDAIHQNSALAEMALPFLLETISSEHQPRLRLDLFYAEGLEISEKAWRFVTDLAELYPQMEYSAYDVKIGNESHALWLDVGKELGFTPTGLPTIIIGGQYWQGFSDAIAEKVHRAVRQCLITPCESQVEKLPNSTVNPDRLGNQTLIMQTIIDFGEPAVSHLLAAMKNANKVILGEEFNFAAQVQYSVQYLVHGVLVDGGLCDTAKSWQSDAIVLCKRGENTFDEKVMHVQEGNGAGVIIYNDGPGLANPTLGKDSKTMIPALFISLADGQTLLQNHITETITVHTVDDVADLANMILAIGEPAIPALVSYINDEYLAWQVVDMLVLMGEPAVQPSMEAFDSGDEATRYYSLCVLKDIADTQALPVVIAGLTDESSRVKIAAASAAGSLKAADTVVYLVDLINDADETVKTAAINALEQIGMPAKTPLIEVYKIFQTNEDPLRIDIYKALKNIFWTQSSLLGKVGDTVCSGKAVPEAAAYNPYSGLAHPLVIIEWQGGFHFTYMYSHNLPIDWMPFSVDELQLVVCLDKVEDKLIQFCPYVYSTSGNDAGATLRIRYQQKVRVYAAKTGILIYSGYMYGSNPDACPASTGKIEPFHYGSRLYYQDLVSWLEAQGLKIYQSE